MKLGILGGTFDPLHIGHLILAQQALEKLKLDKVIFVVNNIPPHKKECFFPGSVRFKMVKEALKDYPYFEASNIELKRRGISYTVDTLKEFKKIYPKAKFYLIIGSDLAKDFFKKWRSPFEILKLSKVCVAKRNRVFKKDKRFLYFDIIQVGISSTFIRERIKENKPIDLFVPKVVKKIIKEYLKR